MPDTADPNQSTNWRDSLFLVIYDSAQINVRGAYILFGNVFLYLATNLCLTHMHSFSSITMSLFFEKYECEISEPEIVYIYNRTFIHIFC